MFDRDVSGTHSDSGLARSIAQAIFTVAAASPLLAIATTQCPPESGEKSSVFWLLGLAVLGFFFVLGLTAPILTTRWTRGRNPWLRGALTLAACVPMLGLWLVGLYIFGREFVMVC